MFDNLPSPAPGFKRVIRVEPNRPGDGYAFSRIYDLVNQWCHMPTPQADIGGIAGDRMAYDDYVCGSLEWQFHKWFPEGILHALPERGLTCLALDVPEDHMMMGQSQVIFDREKAVEVKVLF